ncbi:MAG: fatty acid desaturase family protein [Myxococcota bacterium]|nr:fatty acid desaturase family protein [Myxococcota bacterium]
MTPEHALISAAAVEATQSGPRKPHALEYLGVIGFFILISVLAGRVAEALQQGGVWFIVIAAAVGFVLSDLVSGLVHWLFDTWGSPRTPVLGKNFIIPFRVHHLEPKDITRHGFIATNGHNCLVSVPVLVGCLFLPSSSGWSAPLTTFLVMMTLGVFATNQFHKWAHLAQPPPMVAALQKAGLILSPSHHEVHHAHPYAKHYCITTGWMNRPLDGIKFFRGLEWVITKVTGAHPRRDDLKTS